MKKILYIIIGVMCLGCSYRGQFNKAVEDTVYIAPDDVWDTTEYYHQIDSINKVLRAHSYEMYGDSDMYDTIWEKGLPDSMKLHNP